MDEILRYVRAHQSELIESIRELVECESPTGDPAALARVRDLIANRTAPMAKVRNRPDASLHAEFRLRGRNKRGRILALGHFDTVWPVGTLPTMPFRRNRGRLWGPGVFDMKGGIACFLFAMRALRDLDVPVQRNVLLRLVADEEIGSPGSRAGTAREARRSVAALVLEPAAGLDGQLKTARKGVGHYVLVVHGRPAHAGIDFAAGASATLELARQIERISALTDLDRGVTLNPGVIAGGTRPNVVAGRAEASIDVRMWRAADAARVERKLLGLKPIDKRCRIEVRGGLDHPPMERSRDIARLFRLARKLAAGLGVDLDEASTGGASDGNLTASLGVPTLDGIGVVGEGAHAANESILVDRLADRAALLAHLVRAL